MRYTLKGAIIPKARPRVGNGRGYLPDNYRKWKENAQAQLLSQPRPETPLEDVKVAINLSGKHSRRGDSDNISGSILDALVVTGILRDDNLKCVPSLSLTLNYSKDDPVAEIEIS
jgi:Holliday junction resolvase RusA-like endonuclease